MIAQYIHWVEQFSKELSKNQYQRNYSDQSPKKQKVQWTNQNSQHYTCDLLNTQGKSHIQGVTALSFASH